MSAADSGERARWRALPKAQLHLHLEGSLTPATLWRLAQRQGQSSGLTTSEDCRALYRFSSFDGFIQAIKTASLLLRDPSDYGLAVAELARQLRAEGVVYAEVFWSVGILHWRQVAIEPYWEAIEQARLDAEQATGVRIRWLLDAVRQFGPAPWEQVVRVAITLQSSAIVGVGIGGDERQQATAAFARGFDEARGAGLHTTIHAGETRGADSVAEALRWLRPERIGHGLRAFEDPRVVEALVEAGTWLDICPTSNLKTGVWERGERHPALNYYDSGVKIAVSTDDPGIFDCRLEDEYAYLRNEGGFGPEALEQVILAAWEGSFLPPLERSRYMAGLPGPSAADAG